MNTGTFSRGTMMTDGSTAAPVAGISLIATALTWPPNAEPARMIVLRAQGRRTQDARNTSQRRTDHCDFEAGGERGENGGVVPTAQHHRSDLLPLESQIWRDGGQRGQETEAIGRGKPKAKACGGRSDFGQPRVEGCAVKKLVGPASRRGAASHMMQTYAMSERRVCRLLQLARSTKRYRAGRAIGMKH